MGEAPDIPKEITDYLAQSPLRAFVLGWGEGRKDGYLRGWALGMFVGFLCGVALMLIRAGGWR